MIIQKEIAIKNRRTLNLARQHLREERDKKRVLLKHQGEILLHDWTIERFAQLIWKRSAVPGLISGLSTIVTLFGKDENSEDQPLWIKMMQALMQLLTASQHRQAEAETDHA